jgi:hypothetical protein
VELSPGEESNHRHVDLRLSSRAAEQLPRGNLNEEMTTTYFYTVYDQNRICVVS